MARPPSCPRCAGPLQAPSAFSSAWRCAGHGAVEPTHLVLRTTPEIVEQVCADSGVPCWVPWPMPSGWTTAGLGYAGDGRSPARASVVACTGPAPLGGAAEMLLVAEEPGLGLGAGYAGMPGPDPGPAVDGARSATLQVGGHPTALWTVPAPADRCVAVGEAAGRWLWVILWPAAAGYLLAEDMALHDLRDGVPTEMTWGAHSPYLLRRGR